MDINHHTNQCALIEGQLISNLPVTLIGCFIDDFSLDNVLGFILKFDSKKSSDRVPLECCVG